MRRFRFILALALPALAGCVQRMAAVAPQPPEPSPAALQQARLTLPPAEPAATVPAAWWQSIPAADGELFVGSSDEAAIWVSKRARVTPAGTKVAFSHWEYVAKQGALGVISARFVSEIDCGQGRSRIVESYGYPARQTAGAPVESSLTPAGWTYIQPGSVADGEARLVCRHAASVTAHRQAPPHKPEPEAPEAPPPIASDYF